MIDFTDMEYGVIKTSSGVVIVIHGKFHGPFEIETITKMFEEVRTQRATG